MTFKEKLELINKIYFEKDINIVLIPDNIIAAIEKKLNIIIPEPLKMFYSMFGRKKDFLECMYHIFPLEQLKIENRILTIAVENQGVCSYGLDNKSNRIVCFTKDHIEEIESDIDDFILYLLAVQGTGFFNSVVQIDISESNKIDKNFLKISKISSQYSVYCHENKTIGFISNNNIYMSAKNDDIMNEIENKYNLIFNYC